jgi:hypothetical protein
MPDPRFGPKPIRPALRQTPPSAILDVSPAAYAEIRAKLAAADHLHMARVEDEDGERLDMAGLALRAESPLAAEE